MCKFERNTSKDNRSFATLSISSTVVASYNVNILLHIHIKLFSLLNWLYISFIRLDINLTAS